MIPRPSHILPGLLTFLALLACLAGCFPAPVVVPPTPPGPTVTVDPLASPTPTPFGPGAALPATPSPTAFAAASALPAASPTPASQAALSRYQLEARLDPQARTLTVDERILYRNASSASLPGLVLAVEPNHWAGCFHLEALAADGREVDGAVLDGHRLEVPLPSALAPGADVVLTLSYRLALPAADSGHLFGYYPEQINLVDWFPFVVPYDPQTGWLLHPAGKAGEHLVYDPAAFEVLIRFSDPARAPVAAASAPGIPVEAGWLYNLPFGRTFALSFSPAFESESLSAAGVQVTSYFFPSERASGLAILQEAARAVATYTALFGPCPYTSLAIVESPYFDGMESDGLFLLSRSFYTAADGTVLNDLIDIGVHETAHLWWYGSVGNDQALEPWLDEALATYSEWLFYQLNYPQVSAWWAFRVEAYAPSGPVDTDIYAAGGFRTYADAVYLRGAQFLEALRGRVGDEAFLAFLKDYQAHMAGRRATAADFFAILRLHSAADLSGLQAEYFQTSH